MRVFCVCSVSDEAIAWLKSENHEVVLARACCKSITREALDGDMAWICEQAEAIAIPADFADHAPAAAAHRLAIALGLVILILPRSFQWQRSR
jgi:hypothetical protein